MAEFPARGQQAPAFWDVQLKTYIDERDDGLAVAITSLATGVADTLTGYWTKTESDGRYATTAQGAKADTAVQPAGLTKAAIGLGNVDNTSDANKPVSTAQAAADAAIFGGAALTATDLNTLTKPGIYTTAAGFATFARNYPVDNGSAGIVEVFFEGAVMTTQRFTVRSGTAGGRGIYERVLIASVWQPWRFISTQRVDNPSDQPGLTIYTWDDVTNTERSLAVQTISLGTVDLNLVTRDGIYYQTTTASATLARNYPLVGVLGTLEVSSNGGIHKWTPRSQTYKGFYQRSFAGGIWQPWQFIPAVRVDSTVGRAIYVFDPDNNRDQFVSGDTGWRNITADLLNGWTATLVLIRRVNRTVSLRFRELNGAAATSSTVLTSPSTGFLPYSSVPQEGFMLRPTDNGIPLYGSISNAGSVAIAGPGVARTVTPSPMQGVEYVTNDAWPTVLPGNASGTIPNT